MNTSYRPRIAAALVAASLLAGCAEFPLLGGSAKPSREHPLARESTGKREQKAASPAREQPSQAAREQAALREGIRLYNEGHFDDAIRRLSAGEIAKGSVRTRVTALKYTAFSYCVTARPEACRQSFEKALRLDPSFNLTAGERGHPLWGPVFTQAKTD